MDCSKQILDVKGFANESHRRLLILSLVGVALIGLTAVAFIRVLDCDFVSVDDSVYVTLNRHVNGGLTLEGISYAFTNTELGYWQPVTLLSHMLDCQLFGLNPKGHHFVNLLFHLLNTFLLFYMLFQMTGTLWRSFFVAALFGIHPLHVESVAWIAERKDVLSAFFWMLTIGAYLHYVRYPPSTRRFLPVIMALALGLMAKAMVVTLPFVLLLLDYWPLGRFRLFQRSANTGEILTSRESISSESTPTPLSVLLREKVPLFVLVAVSATVTYMSHKSIGATGAMAVLPIEVRVSNAMVSYVLYIWKTIWPLNLSFFYKYDLHLLSPLHIAGASILLATVTWSSIVLARHFPYVLVGWLWYLGTLVPAIGLVQAGAQSMADRFTYLPGIGLFIIAAWGVADISVRWRYRAAIVGGLPALLILILSSMTWKQVGHWKNDYALYGHAVVADEANFQARLYFGETLLQRGQDEEGFSHLVAALRLGLPFTHKSCAA